MTTHRRLFGSLLLGVLFFGPVAAAPACSVPVFRYALDRWPADAYEVIVFHRGALPGDAKALVTALDRASVKGGGLANLEVLPVDLDDRPEAEMQKLWDSQANAQLPWMVVRYPAAARREETVWATRLTADAVGQLVDSPVRRQVSRLIRGGETGVWLLLECGDKARDDAAAERLRKELARMPEVLKLPELKADDPEDRLAPGPKLRIAFTLLRLSRTDPAEKALVQMLLHSEEDLLKEEYANEPMAFPLFGRGRADFALVGKGIEERNIGEACARLVGPCTCQIKRLSPGIDLLFSADWTTPLREATLSDLGPPTGWLLLKLTCPAPALLTVRLPFLAGEPTPQGTEPRLSLAAPAVREAAAMLTGAEWLRLRAPRSDAPVEPTPAVPATPIAPPAGDGNAAIEEARPAPSTNVPKEEKAASALPGPPAGAFSWRMILGYGLLVVGALGVAIVLGTWKRAG